jgi:hypothetical protein
MSPAENSGVVQNGALLFVMCGAYDQVMRISV